MVEVLVSFSAAIIFLCMTFKRVRLSDIQLIYLRGLRVCVSAVTHSGIILCQRGLLSFLCLWSGSWLLLSYCLSASPLVHSSFYFCSILVNLFLQMKCFVASLFIPLPLGPGQLPLDAGVSWTLAAVHVTWGSLKTCCVWVLPPTL